MKHRVPVVVLTGLVSLSVSGCSRITARNLDKTANEAKGIPFYLPKPYLIVAKNVRYIPTPTVGLTAPVPVPEEFDESARELTLTAAIDQQRALTLERTLAEESKFERLEEDKRLLEERLERLEEDKKSDTTETTETIETPEDIPDPNTNGTDPELQSDGDQGAGGPGARGVASNRQVLGITGQTVVPAGQIPDGLIPDTFYTYQIVYLPDLTQKYGLEIRGGPGELRATMNLVNGWMHTGSGPLYMRDSTTAARTVAAGVAIGNVIDSLAGLGFAMAGPMLPAPTPGAIPRIIPGQKLPVCTGTELQSAEETPTVKQIKGYAELYIFEPVLEEKMEGGLFDRRKVKTVRWRLLSHGVFGTDRPVAMDREYLTMADRTSTDDGDDTPDGDKLGLSTIAKWINQEWAGILAGLKTVDNLDVQITRVEPRGFNVIVLGVNGKLADESGARKKLISAVAERWPDKPFLASIAYKFEVASP